MNPPRGNADARRAMILDAALRVFGQYGYRRTSMDDIARKAQITKGTICLSFASKEEVFQALSRSLSQRMLAGAGAARRRPGTTADKLAAMNAAWFGTYAETVRRSPHAAELLDAKRGLSATWSPTPQAGTSNWSRPPGRSRRCRGAGPGIAGLTADTAAELLIASARGLQSSAASPTAYRRYLNTLARVMVAGLRQVKPS